MPDSDITDMSHILYMGISNILMVPDQKRSKPQTRTKTAILSNHVMRDLGILNSQPEAPRRSTGDKALAEMMPSKFFQ